MAERIAGAGGPGGRWEPGGSCTPRRDAPRSNRSPLPLRSPERDRQGRGDAARPRRPRQRRRAPLAGPRRTGLALLRCGQRRRLRAPQARGHRGGLADQISATTPSTSGGSPSRALPWACRARGSCGQLWPFVVSFSRASPWSRLVRAGDAGPLGRAAHRRRAARAAGNPLWLVIFTPSRTSAPGLHAAGLCCGALLLVHRAALRPGPWGDGGRLRRRDLRVLSVLGMHRPADRHRRARALTSRHRRLRAGGWRLDGRSLVTAVFAVVTGALILLGGSLIAHALQAKGVVATPFPIVFAPASQLIADLENALAAFAGARQRRVLRTSGERRRDSHTAVAAGGLCPSWRWPPSSSASRSAWPARSAPSGTPRCRWRCASASGSSPASGAWRSWSASGSSRSPTSATRRRAAT